MAKRLLFLAPELPSDRESGNALRMYHQLRFLGSWFLVDLIVPAEDGAEHAAFLLHDVCDVTVVPLQGPSLFDRFWTVGSYPKDRAVTSVVQERLAGGAYGAIHVNSLSMMPYVPEDSTRPVILDLQLPSSELPQGPRSASRSKHVLHRLTHRLVDRWCWPTTHCVTVASEEDRIRCERAQPGQHVLVVPNGVDCQQIPSKLNQVMASPILLFTGDMDAEQNIEAAVCLATEVFPAIRRELPKSELRIVGRNPDARVSRVAGQGVVVIGADTELPIHVREATLYVAPYTAAAGARASLLAAMAGGLPIITTSLGIEGMKVQAGRDVLVADQPADIIESIQTLLASQPDRERFGQAARRMAEVWYDWSRCLWPLESLYQPLLTSKHPPETNAIAC